MKTFKYHRSFIVISTILFTLTLINCNQISRGEQRKKFEFLYKLSNYGALLGEYTGSITYYSELDFYEGRMKILYADVNRIELMKNWGTSRLLKEKFLETIDENLRTLTALRQKQFPVSENIRHEYDVIIMNERVENFMKALNDAISEVGKE